MLIPTLLPKECWENRGTKTTAYRKNSIYGNAQFRSLCFWNARAIIWPIVRNLASTFFIVSQWDFTPTSIDCESSKLLLDSSCLLVDNYFSPIMRQFGIVKINWCRLGQTVWYLDKPHLSWALIWWQSIKSCHYRYLGKIFYIMHFYLILESTVLIFKEIWYFQLKDLKWLTEWKLEFIWICT